MLKTCYSESGISSDDDESVPNSKLVVDLQKMPAGQYEYYTDTATIMNQMLLYMYHTINNLVHIPDSGVVGSNAAAVHIPLKLRRRPYKYDKDDFCYAQIGFGDYKYTYTVPATKTEPETSAEFFINYRQQEKIVGTQDAPEKFEYIKIRTDSPVVFHHFYRESDNFLENNEVDVSKLHVYVMSKYGEWMRYNKIPSRTPGHRVF